MLSSLEAEGRSLRGDEVFLAFPELASFLDKASLLAVEAAQRQMNQLAHRARTEIQAEREASERRLMHSLAHQQLPPEAIEFRISKLRGYYQGLLGALDGLRVKLDSLAAFAINR